MLPLNTVSSSLPPLSFDFFYRHTELLFQPLHLPFFPTAEYIFPCVSLVVQFLLVLMALGSFFSGLELCFYQRNLSSPGILTDQEIHPGISYNCFFLFVQWQAVSLLLSKIVPQLMAKLYFHFFITKILLQPIYKLR